ncbi:MAG TPA: glycosyltransferase family 4 protein [Rhodothermales bacterium]|nr:glycosyltransferase family 4 protein [Rhodothermales bacterium]
MPTYPVKNETAASKKKPRVLFVAGILGKNGISSHIRTLAEGLLAREWDVGIAASELKDGAPLSREFMASRGIAYFQVPFPDFIRSSGNLGNALKSTFRMNAAARSFKPDVIHVHGLGTVPFAYVTGRFRKIPLVSTCHNTPPPRTEALARKLSGANKYLNAILGNRVIAISRDMQTVMEDLWKVQPRRVKLILHGVEGSHFRPPSVSERITARRSFNLRPEDKVVCLVGRLDHTKGHDVLLRAIARLRSDGCSAVALFGGVGPLKSAIERMAKDLGVADQVHLLGFTDARTVLWASDAFVLPSRREGFPLVILEAMLCGVVPIRTPAAGAFEQIEDAVNGFIVPFDDDENLAQRLSQVLGNSELRSRMSQSSVERARRKFTSEIMLDETVATYREVGAVL